ncbi:MAG: hypothetical protein ABF682_00890 [Liquorilactobacillus sp.]|uniref:hypothetical protein n=1 Tax=Liquorilactobacillus sp. TaxID=2767923 RepID=UPI0039E7CB9A
MKNETYISILIASLLFPAAFWLITFVDYPEQVNATIGITILAMPVIAFSTYKILKNK